MDKFILAMIGMAIALLIIISGGFIAVEYFKSHPEAFQVKPLSK
ncbi:hypothetical protein [Neisseria sp.]